MLKCKDMNFASRPEHVFIISFDGGKPSVIAQSKMPTLQKLARDGAASWEAQTVMPSVTLVSHTSMLTGVKPVKHKIDWNTWEPAKGIVTVPTVFAIAKAHAKEQKTSITTAMFFGKEKFFHLAIPGTIDAVCLPDYSAKIVATQAAQYIQMRKPYLTFIHFADPDGAGHDKGWGSKEQMAAFADCDNALKVVLSAIQKAGIAQKSTLILSADHGGHDKTHGENIPADMTIPWIAYGAGIRPRTTLAVPISTCDTTATALQLLNIPLPAELDGQPVWPALRTL
jgi:predicted AlkP superfamily pyrophosphatase or phosphodiesterase